MIHSTVTVIVPVADGGDAFAVTLASLKALDPAPLEIIVVGDGSSDGSLARARVAGATVIETASRRGPAAARNLGARDAAGDVLFFVDADVAVRPDAIARVTSVLSDPTLAAVIGSYDAAPTAPGFLSQYRNLAHRYCHQTARPDGFTFWGACGAIRRSAFEGVHGFDERYTAPSIEDIELGYRLKAAGHRIRVDSALEVTHLKRWTPLALIRTDFACRALPWSELILREGHFDDDLNLQVRARIAVAGVWLVLLLLATSVAADSTAAGLAALATAAGLLTLDAGLWRYLATLRGPVFAAAAIPWQWLQYASSGLAFGIAAFRHALAVFRPRRLETPA